MRSLNNAQLSYTIAPHSAYSIDLDCQSGLSTIISVWLSRCMVASAILFAAPQLAIAQLDMRYDSKGHPKAKGVWVAVKYPGGWKSEEGERPNIVQKFSGRYQEMDTVLSLQILNAGAPVESECKAMSINDAANAFSAPASKVYASDFKKIMHENKPAFLYEMKGTVERAGMAITAHHKVMTVCYKNTLISAWCSPSRFDRASNKIFTTAAELSKASPLCFEFFNSLVLMDNY